MKMKQSLLLVAWGTSVVLSAAPVFAQSHADLVAMVKSQLRAQGKDLSGPCGAFAITKRVAWLLKAEGAGLLSKPAGNNCDGYSVDYVTYPDGSGVDILGDAGGTNAPGWDLGEPAGALSGRWRAPVDPGDGNIPNSGPIIPNPGMDLSELIARVTIIQQAVADIRQQNLVHETAEAVEREKANQFREDVKSAWRNRFVFLGKYIAPTIGGVLAGWKLR